MEKDFVLVLVALAIVVVWAVGVYTFPFRACRKCGGAGRKVRHLNRNHFRLCTRCGGAGRVQRPGSRLVHRAALAGRTEMARQRRERVERKAAARSAVPTRPVYRVRGR
jgi:DnaJ-class molecular chaperone